MDESLLHVLMVDQERAKFSLKKMGAALTSRLLAFSPSFCLPTLTDGVQARIEKQDFTDTQDSN